MTQFNPSDKITVDVPLFIRLLEYAREDAKTDMDLHDVAEKAVAASKTGKTLTMADYDGLVSGNAEDKEMNELKRMIKLANIKTFFQ
jgi:phage gp29-like protein